MTQNIEFQGGLYSNTRDLADAIAGEWMSAGGANDAADIAGFLASATDGELADEAISGWGLDQSIDHGYDADGHPAEEIWLATRGLDRSDIVAAFERYRADIDA